LFENLTGRLQQTFRNLTGSGRVSEGALLEALREIRLALLEADVAVPVVKTLLDRVREKALGEEVLKSLTPGDQVLKVVRDELVGLLGAGMDTSLKISAPWPSVFLMVGLQGSGKTTSSAKIGLLLKKKGRNPLLVPADVHRPAAQLQLLQVAREAGVAAFDPPPGQTPGEICKAGLARARQAGFDVLLVDTAGRLHVDEDLMAELTGLKALLNPTEVLFVADAMTGQDAVVSARYFHERVGVTGIVLTKMDGDARGGAALSVTSVTGVPIKIVGTGEKLAAVELFHPERMAGRILGMGDVLTLIEKAEETYEVEEAKALEKKLRRNEFTLEDFRDQLRKLKKMGPLSEILGLLPGMGAARQLKEAQLDNAELVRIEAIIDSMTPLERNNHTVLNGSRRRRIARGSGTSVQEVNRLVKQFAQMKRMMKSLAPGMGGAGKRPKLPHGLRMPGGFR
jgi:signal recognition particle subunit SRP54